MQKDIKSVILIFPEFEDKIESLFLTDENFQDLCSDFVLCTKSVHEMKEDLNRYKAQIEEYESLKRNLKQEILKMIAKGC